MKVTKAALHRYIRSRLATDETWALRALVVLFEHQTDKEQSLECDIFRNWVGFALQDASFLTPIAKQYVKEGTLEGDQVKWVKKLVSKYSRQIIEFSDREKLEKMVVTGSDNGSGIPVFSSTALSA